MIEQCPESSLGYFSLGRFYVEVGRFAEAIAPLERCLAENPEWTAALVALGDAFQGSGEKAKALAAFQQAKKSPHAQRHGALAREIDQRLDSLSRG